MFAPIAMAGLAMWFLFNIVVCMDGQSGPATLLVCDWVQLLPDALGLILVVSLVSMVLALRDLEEIDWMEPLLPSGRLQRLRRNTVKIRRGYDNLEVGERDEVLFALEMSTWCAGLAAATLVFYWGEMSLPLALVVVAGLCTTIVRLVRRMIKVMRGPDPASSDRNSTATTLSQS